MFRDVKEWYEWWKQYLFEQPKYSIVHYRNLTPRKVKASLRMYQYPVITSASLERTRLTFARPGSDAYREWRERTCMQEQSRERKRERRRMDRALVTPFEARLKSRKEDDDNDGNRGERGEPVPIFAWKAKPTGARANPKRRNREKIRNRNARENHYRSRDRPEPREERERDIYSWQFALRTMLAIISCESPRRIRRAVSLFIEEETRFRFFQLTWLSRGISYGKTAEKRIFVRLFESISFQEKFRIKWRIIWVNVSIVIIKIYKIIFMDSNWIYSSKRTR